MVLESGKSKMEGLHLVRAFLLSQVSISMQKAEKPAKPILLTSPAL
jgi:hypothetical protein